MPVRVRTPAPRRRRRHIVRGDVFANVTAHSFCRGFFPNRTRCAGLRFGFPHAYRYLFMNAFSSRSKVRFAPAYFLPLAENKPSARSCLPSCGTRLWLQRINRLANRRPLCQQILAVSRAAGALICCPFPQKVTLHLRCSLVHQLATLRFAIVPIQILRLHLFR